MEISDVRVRIIKDASDRLKAVCSITLDESFVVRDVKIVEGTSGLFVAMPSRKISGPCSTCRTQNHLRAKYCNECGGKLPPARIPSDENGREKAHRDIAHPITASFRQTVQKAVLEAYHEECEPTGTIEATHDDAERDTEASGERVSEYGAIIADLKGRADRPDGDDDAREGPRVESGEPGRRRRRRDRGRRGDQPEGGEEQPPAQREAETQESSTASPWESEAAEPVETTRVERPADEDVTDSEERGRVGGWEAEKPATPPPGRDSEPSGPPASQDASEQPPPSKEDEDEDDVPFGAGLL